MIVVDVPQGTPEWLQARAGLLTASCAGDAFARTKSGWAASRKNLVMRLVLERLTGKPQGSDFVSPAMERGTELEPDARRAYESSTGYIVDQVGFIRHDTLKAGGSPDGLVGTDGIVEFKCPGAAVHLEYLKGSVPNGHLLQVTHLLWLTGRKWADLVSFHPDFPEALRLATRRLTVNDMELLTYENGVVTFLNEVQREQGEVLALMEQ